MAPKTFPGDVGLEFYPQDPAFNRCNALYLAHASDVAYLRAPVTAAEERLGLQAVAFRHKLTRARGYLGVCDTHAVLAFRGSDPRTLPNWLTDMVVKLVECNEYDGRVHYGFSSVLGGSWSQISAIMDRIGDRPLFVTGHSLGGALSVLAASRLAKLGRPPVATYTFGSPRVGDPTFCAGYALPTYRIINCLDIVPEMPLASLKRLLPEKPRLTNEKILERLKRMAEQAPCYAHVNTPVYIDGDGRIMPGVDIERWHTQAVLSAIATRGKPFVQGITDHLLSNYIRGLQGQSQSEPTATRSRGSQA